MLWRRSLRLRWGLGHSARDAGWAVPVVRTIASTGSGVAELVGSYLHFSSWLGLEGRLERPGALSSGGSEFWKWFVGSCCERFGGLRWVTGSWRRWLSRVAGGVENPYLVVPRLLAGIRLGREAGSGLSTAVGRSG